MYDVNVFFVPILTGTNVTFSASIKKKFKEAAQDDLKSHVLICDEDGKQIIEQLKMDHSEVPYFFLLDPQGKIIYQTNGHFTDEKFDKIDDLISG
jgi:predicted transcriptional regulator